MLRDDFVAEIRSWIGTPYMQDAGVKGGGTNCSRFALAAVEKVLGVNGSHLKTKPHKVLLRDDPHTIVSFLDSFCERVPAKEMKKGDIAIISIASIPCWAAVFVGNGNFVFVPRRACVLEGPLPSNIEEKITHIFRVKAFLEEAAL